MNTHVLGQFDVMDNETLSTVEGGKISGGEAVAAIGICATASAAIGGLAGATLVTPYCVGTWGLIRSN
ncbi:Blp family class II bacteriocin [Streptococcus mutans]|uniref:Blp family class II bacteriocin n=1 Tax=Streptococcus mutans TaxID=1309 RepID=UPI000B6670F2|nr:Blp family class II bacteriocin [Streptococcus mutans]MCY7128705.1 Blp family class II bacteriocin [Streptococcus mutans]OVF01163.1 ComC/BlpC family peptide pheromone/bacteriocin [Streptococcus mutans]